MAWLALWLFLPWFSLLGVLFWIFPRQPRTPCRRRGDAVVLCLALGLGIAAMHWGHASGERMAGPGALWAQVMAVLAAYGVFLAVMAVALWWRPRWWGAPAPGRPPE